MKDAYKMGEQIFPYSLFKLMHQVDHQHWIQVEIKAGQTGGECILDAI
jgi:hypothetical protein